VERADGRSPFLLACDHAGAHIPARLNSLALPAGDLQRHIAWDIGAAAVAVQLAARLDAFLIRQNYSRLVIDCNRPLASAESIVPVSDGTRIPGNASVTAADRLARQREVFHPYHDRLRAELDARRRLDRPTILIALHSFTPRLNGCQRPWHIGLLFNRDRRLADGLHGQLATDPDLVIGMNEPYAVDDESDYTIPEHAERRGLPHVGIELRQDLIAGQAGQNEWAERLASALARAATAGIGSPTPRPGRAFGH